MARKKKTNDVPAEEPKPPVEEEVTSPAEDLEDACFIPFENGFVDTEESATTVSVYTDEPVEPIPTPFAYEDYAKKISHAFDVIEKCNLMMWAGLDWGTGRIYEMSRKEWATYILDMYDWSDGKFKGKEPEMPSEVREM